MSCQSQRTAKRGRYLKCELQFRRPAGEAGEVREEGVEYLVNRLSVLDEERRESILRAFNTLLDQVGKD